MPSRKDAAAAYLGTLAETGNATLAVERAGVSRDWAYKRRRVDPAFDRLCREIGRQAKPRLRVRVNRDREGGWTARQEGLFLAVLAATRRLALAAAAVGRSAAAAYNRRRARPGFAAECARVRSEGDEWLEGLWLESAACPFDGEPLPADNPVRRVTVAEMMRVMARIRGGEEGPSRE